MGRGSGTQRTLAKEQYDYQKQLTNRLMGERAGDRGRLLPMAEELARSEGYDPAERAAITRGGMESLDAGFDAGDAAMGKRAARTRNSAGFFSHLRKGAGDRAIAKGDMAANLEGGFADEKQRRRQAGLGFLANLYGVDSNLVGNSMGLPIAALGQHAAGIGRGGFGIGPVSASWG